MINNANNRLQATAHNLSPGNGVCSLHRYSYNVGRCLNRDVGRSKMRARNYILIICAMLFLLVGCMHTHQESDGRNHVFSQFCQASAVDRQSLADPVISQLRGRIGMHVSELTQLMGQPEDWGGNPGDSQHADLKYTVYHKNDTWRYFVVTIRDWKVVWVGDVETVIQM